MGGGVWDWCPPVRAGPDGEVQVLLLTGKCLVSLQGEDRAALSPTGKSSPAEPLLALPASQSVTFSPLQGAWPPVAQPV